MIHVLDLILFLALFTLIETLICVTNLFELEQYMAPKNWTVLTSLKTAWELRYSIQTEISQAFLGRCGIGL